MTTKSPNLNEIPENLNPETIKYLFLNLVAQEQNIAPKNCMEIVLLLAERQWQTYEMIEEDLKVDIVKLICKIWDHQCLESTKSMTSIVGLLGLVDLIPVMQDSLKTELPSLIRKEIKDALQEYGDNISDPYSGMR